MFFGDENNVRVRNGECWNKFWDDCVGSEVWFEL